ncbi:MAG: amino acid lyase [Geothrix sp.]|uniref:beta-eliminating lyase-related protein n=1 Tax=Geothrix sp. TaxID=1962974 RepID=UPI0017D104AD|nr:beta-eliminating lyase-related protein [Geothrix sp.]NWJ40883.1 amino acid lyase [Geothrix sp.]WIL21116.1 MAG: beta-eliminating lyase-related protein [Geothrix sp.]
MDRRSFLNATLAVSAAGALAPLSAQGRPTPMPGETMPTHVWLVGDAAPTDPAAYAARLARLASREKVRDTYLAQGAVTELEQAFASLLGKEDCAFFPTGTLANNVAVRVLCADHPHALVQHESHFYRDESDAAQRLAGISLVPLAAGRATPTLQEVATAFDEAEKGPFAIKVGAISLESPVRRQRGQLVPPSAVQALTDLGKAHGAGLHLDGARLLLAPPSLDLKAYVAPFTTVYVSLYKYLDAPFGAVLAGSSVHMAKAREFRHIYGGLLYQGWEAALIALDSLKTFPQRMARAHGVAQDLMKALEASGKVRRRVDPYASNIHFLEMDATLAQAATERGRAAGVRLGPFIDGALTLGVNDTINRRPVEDYVKLFL